MSSCRHCAGPITGPAYRVRKAVFCGKQCRGLHQRIKPTHGQPSLTTRVCDVCGTGFTFNTSRRQNARFCSTRCTGQGLGLERLGTRPGKGYYSDPRSFRNVARFYFLPKCAHCGWQKAACDVAHIVPRKGGGTDTVDNVILLCPNHHREYDTGQITQDEILSKWAGGRNDIPIPQCLLGGASGA